MRVTTTTTTFTNSNNRNLCEIVYDHSAQTFLVRSSEGGFLTPFSDIVKFADELQEWIKQEKFNELAQKTK